MSKCRCLGLAGVPRDLPFEGLDYAVVEPPRPPGSSGCDRLRLTKDLRIASRANASLGATRAEYGAFPDHEVAPGLSTAELTAPWPGGMALRPIPAGARPYAGALHARVRVAAPRAPRRYGTPRPTVPPVGWCLQRPGRSGVPRARGACLQGNRWRCRLGTLTRRLLVELNNAEVDVSSSAASTGSSFRGGSRRAD